MEQIALTSIGPAIYGTKIPFRVEMLYFYTQIIDHPK